MKREGLCSQRTATSRSAISTQCAFAGFGLESRINPRMAFSRFTLHDGEALMIKAHYKTMSGRVTVEVSGDSIKDVYRDLAMVQEVLDAESKCGCCNSDQIGFGHRIVDDNQFFELRCRACTAQFSFGQTKKGERLFPKRKDKDGNTLPNGGWSVWQGARHEEEEYFADAPKMSRPQSAPVVRPAVQGRAARVPEFKDWDAAAKSEIFGKRDLVIKVEGYYYIVNTRSNEYVQTDAPAA